MPYSCTINGACEYDVGGKHPTLALCQANCVPYDGDILPDLLYDILAFNLEDARDLAPSDINVILFRLTGIRAPLSHVRLILTYVIDKDYLALWRFEYAKDYVRSLMEDEMDILILDTVRGYVPIQPDWEAFKNRVTRWVKSLFREASVSYKLLDVLEDDPPTNLADLIDLLQQSLAEDIVEFASLDENDNDPYMPGFRSHWNYLVERFGSVIPYQRYIVE